MYKLILKEERFSSNLRSKTIKNKKSSTIFLKKSKLTPSRVGTEGFYWTVIDKKVKKGLKFSKN